MKTEQTPTVRVLNPRAHLDPVLGLEAAAAADPRRIYEGVPWTAGGFREFLRGGRGLVAVNAANVVVGFAMFVVAEKTVIVSKIVFQSRAAEDALLAALWNTVYQLNRQLLDLPLILDVG